MADIDAWYAARQYMVDALIADLAGLGTEDSLDEAPLRRFAVAILHPRESARFVETDLGDDSDQDAGTEIDADFDPGVSFAHMRKPSTMGLTIGVGQATSALDVTISADQYQDIADGDDANWVRRPVGPVTISIPLTAASHGTHPVASTLR